MFVLRATFCSFVLFVASIGLASAQTVGETTIGGGLSILGATLESAYQVAPDLRMRGVVMGGLNYSDTEEDDDGNAFDIDLSVGAAAFLVDHYPSGPGWRISGGLLVNLSDIAATGRGAETEPFEINGETFDGGVVTGEAEFANNLAPMITAGYDYDFGNDWYLSAEVGAIYIGGIETSFTANSDALQDAVDDDPDFRDAQADAEDIDFLPYVSMTVSFRF